MWGRGLIGSNGTCSTLCQFSVTPSATHNQIGPFWCWFPSGLVCVCSRTLWVSPTNSPMRLGVSPTAASTPTGVFNQWFEALFPWAGTLGGAVCHLVHQLLPCWPAAATTLPCKSSLPKLPISALPTSLDECFLTPWFLDFHIVQFSVSSDWFLFLNCPSFGCARRHSVSTYTSILARSPFFLFLNVLLNNLDSTAQCCYGHFQRVYTLVSFWSGKKVVLPSSDNW